MGVWYWLSLVPWFFGAGHVQEAGCKELPVELLDPLALLQLDTAIQPSFSNHSLLSHQTLSLSVKAVTNADGGVHESFELQSPLVRIPLLCLAFMLAHGWLFRSWKSIFLLIIPLGLMSIPVFLGVAADDKDRGFFIAKTCSVAAFMELMTALCVACASEEDAWPLNGFVYRFCARHLKGRNWPFVVLYLGLSVNILEAVLQDLAFQHTLNAITGLCLVASTPLPGAGIFPYPIDLIRKYDMATQSDLQGLDLSDEDLQSRISDWYVVLMQRQGGHSVFGDLCCRLPISWIWLYTSWNACFMFDNSILNDWTLAVLLVPLFESQRIFCVLRRNGIALDGWVNSHWLQARAFSLWLWFVVDGLAHKLFVHPTSIADWFQLTAKDEVTLRHYWGSLNLAWGVFHLAWFWHRAYRLSQARAEECNEAKRPASR